MATVTAEKAAMAIMNGDGISVCDIADAIDAAVTAERERCATIAREWARTRFPLLPAVTHAAECIERSIRDRSTSQT